MMTTKVKKATTVQEVAVDHHPLQNGVAVTKDHRLLHEDPDRDLHDEVGRVRTERTEQTERTHQPTVLPMILARVNLERKENKTESTGTHVYFYKE